MYSGVPAYTEISHFRAPYKNSVISGFGEVAPNPSEAYLTTDARGYKYLKPEMQTLFMKAMDEAYVRTQLSADRQKISALTPEQISAMAADPVAKAAMEGQLVGPWIRSKVKDGHVVFANQALVFSVLGGVAIPSGVDEIACAKSGSAAAKQAAKDYGLVILGGDPDMDLSQTGGQSEDGFLANLGPAGTAALAAAVVGGAYLLLKKKK